MICVISLILLIFSVFVIANGVKQSRIFVLILLDCFVVALLAMTLYGCLS
jgi:hypothetical protein